ncbi:hypothetical protein [Acetivibrio cellulolyticus]|uniref:hypothetical protein n=1 Tax=Acetivibrio cellulolyticus TaxID=35830 RepID=UPI0001E2D8C0|nr:hypothetical protein [Acetivibrio cellulolyticus]
MISLERLLSIEKNDILEASNNLNSEELNQLIEWLSEKDDKVRYQAFLLLQSRSGSFDDIYGYWDVFYKKLKSENSYQRSIGLMLIAENVRWDNENKFEEIIDDYALLFNDDKPITVRQCIQSLKKIIPYKKQLHLIIADKIIGIDISSIRATMQKLVLLDILEVLTMIRKYQTNDKIESYIFKALSGGVLDKKAIKQVESMML